MRGVYMDKQELKYEITVKFINEVRENISQNDSTKNVAVVPRNDDSSLSVSTEDEETILLSFSG
jgi:hypothetical protein